MTEDELFNYHIDFSHHNVYLGKRNLASDYIDEIAGTIRHSGRKVGHFEFSIAQVGAALQDGAGFDVHDMLSAHSSEADQYRIVCGSGHGARKAVGELFVRRDADEWEWEEIMIYRLIMLDRIYVRPAHRGKGLAEAVIRRIIAQYGNDDSTMIAFHPWPMAEHVDEFNVDENAAHVKLKQHYAAMGFKRVPASPLMVHHTSWPLRRLP